MSNDKNSLSKSVDNVDDAGKRFLIESLKGNISKIQTIHKTGSKVYKSFPFRAWNVFVGCICRRL
jgi:hypothetical protein